MIVIPIHSIIDRITNSSTEIFTNYTKSIKAAYDLIQEILKLMGRTEKAEDIFDISVENLECFSEWYSDTAIKIIAKDTEFEPLADSMRSFIYSPTHEAEYNG